MKIHTKEISNKKYAIQCICQELLELEGSKVEQTKAEKMEKALEILLSNPQEEKDKCRS